MSQSTNPHLTPALERSLATGYKLAVQDNHEFMTLEHLLWGTLQLPEVQGFMQALSVNVKDLEAEIASRLHEQDRPADTDGGTPAMTVAVQRVLHRAVEMAQAQQSGTGVQPLVSVGAILLQILDESDSFAASALHKRHVDQRRLKVLLAHGPERLHALENPAQAAGVEEDETRGPAGKGKALSRFATNLNERAKDSKIDPLIGRIAEVTRAAQVLGRRRKNNPLLVGDPGVGKTAIAEGLAYQIVTGTAPRPLTDKVIWSLDLGAMIAGTKYRGDFEQRIKDVLDEVRADPNIILFIDEIHNLIGAGSGSGAMDASNIVKPALASGELKVIGATTFKEYRSVFEKDSALARRFQKVNVPEPSLDETLEILKGVAPSVESHHHVRFSAEALRAAVDLSGRYLTDRRWPDKAIDVLDEAGSAEALKDPDDRPEILGKDIIEEVVARIAGVPVERMTDSSDDRTRNVLRTLDTDIKTVLFGQDEAVDALSDAVRVAKAGLADERRPLGSFLFAGPTGVGKTELARQLAERLGVDLVRFDMSEYQEAHTVSRLIGAPPGYVGSDKGGLLTDAISQKPHAILLLDEIEKAHPAVFNLLLQVMDNGTLTDTDGRSVNFRNVFLVMTTNAGAEARQRPSIGFTTVDHSSDATLDLAKVFSPEFRNRLDAVVSFNSLSHDAIARVVDKNIAAVSRQLVARHVTLEVSQAARDRLARDGYDPKMGARPMARQIHENIKKPLSGPMLFGELVHGGAAHLDVDPAGAWAWTFEALTPALATPSATDDDHRPASWSGLVDAVSPLVKPLSSSPPTEIKPSAIDPDTVPVVVPRRSPRR